MHDKITHYFVIPTLGIKQADFDCLPFGRQIEYMRKIESFKASAKNTHISQKRQSFTKALKDFRTHYRPKSYYCRVRTGTNWHDDSVEIWYNE